MAVKSLTVIRAFYSKLIFMCHCFVWSLNESSKNGNLRKVILLDSRKTEIIFLLYFDLNIDTINIHFKHSF